MITSRRADARHHEQRHKQDSWFTFDPHNGDDQLATGFGVLEIFNEYHLPPGEEVPRHQRREAEILTYVREGAVAYEDSSGRSGVIHAGEFRRLTAPRGIRHSETNASRTDWAHVFQLWLHPSEAELDSGQEQKRFSAAERRGRLTVVASPDARKGSLRIHQDALVYSALLDPGDHVVHEIRERRSAWLHIVKGEAVLGDTVLETGDGAGFSAERSVSLTAREETEILLVDLPEPRPAADERRATA